MSTKPTTPSSRGRSPTELALVEDARAFARSSRRASRLGTGPRPPVRRALAGSPRRTRERGAVVSVHDGCRRRGRDRRRSRPVDPPRARRPSQGGDHRAPGHAPRQPRRAATRPSDPRDRRTHAGGLVPGGAPARRHSPGHGSGALAAEHDGRTRGGQSNLPRDHRPRACRLHARGTAGHRRRVAHPRRPPRSHTLARCLRRVLATARRAAAGHVPPTTRWRPTSC